MGWIGWAVAVLFVSHGTENSKGFAWPSINLSNEHRLRQELFPTDSNYDRMVRSVINSSEAVKIKLVVQLNGIVNVDRKGQVVSTDTFIKQRWNNSFFMWNASEFGGLEKILVSPDEIWAPDIVLYDNNADDNNVAQAGYTENFKTWIIIYHNGTSDWTSPVSLKSTCNFDVTYFPYDEHSCQLIFGSLTSDKSLIDIETEERQMGRDEGHENLEKTKENEKDDEFEQMINNGGWSIQMIEVEKEEEASQRMSPSVRGDSFELCNSPQASSLCRLLDGALYVNWSSNSRQLLHSCGKWRENWFQLHDPPLRQRLSPDRSRKPCPRSPTHCH